MTGIHFFADDLPFKLKHPQKTVAWIKTIIRKEKWSLQALSYIFCSDASLLSMNLGYLNHSTLTDIITFDLTEKSRTVNGEIYISIERVKENATKFHVAFENELHRVMIHGVFHLLGYGDKKATEKALMRKKEDSALSLL